MVQQVLMGGRWRESRKTSTFQAQKPAHTRLETQGGTAVERKMPTGAPVGPAMNHGGPYPGTGHLGFAAVGLPTSMRRFAMLQCFNAASFHRLLREPRD